MLQHLKNKLYALYLAITSSIAFYPTLISLSMLALAGILLSLEDDQMTKFLLDNAPYLVVDNAETARSILSTLIGGILSLMVFSFSMVMVLLNQASSNFSPRLLPGLISDKRNQLVLGTYLGTIIYNIIVMISIVPSGDEYTINGFSILVGILFGILCLAMFVFFIHSISTNIQINNILKEIFDQAKGRLNHLIEAERQEAVPPKVANNWHSIKSTEAGYYQGVNITGLTKFVDAHNVNVKVIPTKGMYVLPNDTIIKYDTDLSEDQIKALGDYLIYSGADNVGDNYVLGIKQITEVGVKAMSPGINDPGTAVMTIDYLTELLALRMQIDELEVYKNSETDYTLQLSTVSFDDLVYEALAAYRQYCKHDIILMQKLISMLSYLSKQPTKHDDYSKTINEQIQILEEAIEGSIDSDADRQRLFAMIR